MSRSHLSNVVKHLPSCEKCDSTTDRAASGQVFLLVAAEVGKLSSYILCGGKVLCEHATHHGPCSAWVELVDVRFHERDIANVLAGIVCVGSPAL